MILVVRVILFLCPHVVFLCVSFLRAWHWFVEISVVHFKDNLYLQWPLSNGVEIRA